MGSGRFFCRDEQERDWQREMQARLWRATLWLSLGFGLPVAACFFWFEPWAAAALLSAMATFAGADRYIARTGCSELLGPIAFPGIAAYAAFAGLSGYAADGALALIIFPMATVAGCLPGRVVIVLLGWTAGLMVATALIAAPDDIASRPPILIIPLAVLLAVTAAQAVPRASSAEHRVAAIIDPLTSMLNRKALEARCFELELQARITGEPVGLIVCDLDRFKFINDAHGHAMGDAVLVEVAYRLRKHLRAFDAAFRLGGEEFVALVPGADAAATAVVAERLAAAVRDEPVGRVTVTASFGVAATSIGDPFDFDDVFARADGALYAAKLAGRDCVRLADDAPPPAVELAA